MNENSIPVCITDYTSNPIFKTDSYYSSIITEQIVSNKTYFVIKSNFCIQGVSGHNSSLILKDYIPTYSASVYTLLLNSGDLCRGIAVNDSFCMGVGQNSICTLTKEGYPVGGSSSGPAYLVANQSFIEYGIGSDTAGSIVMPAVQNRLYGFHPSRGKISRWGMHEYCPQLDRVGILAKSSTTLERVVKLLTVYDFKDGLMEQPFIVENPIIGLKVYVQEDLKEYINLDYEFKTINWKAVEQFYQTKIQPYAYSSLQRYDGVRFNNRWSAAKSEQQKTNLRNSLLTRTVKQRIKFGYLATENFTPEDTLMCDLNNSIILLKHTVKTTLKQLQRYEYRYALANVLNGVSLTIPVSNEVSLEIIAPSGCERTIFQILNYVK